MGRLIIIAGHPGSGKTYFMENLSFLGDDYVGIKKKTTRSPRKNESQKTSVEFFFNCSRKEIKRSDYCYVYRDELYGVSFKDIDAVISKNLTPVIILKPIDVIKELKEKYKNTITILFVPELSIYLRQKQAWLEGSSKDETKKRFFSEDQKSIIKEYEENESVFDKIICNKFDDNFLEEIKCYLDQTIPNYR